MRNKKWIFQTEFLIGLIMVVVLLAVITIISAGSFVTSSLPLMLTYEDTADTFNSTLPDRSLVFQVASGPRETPEEPADEPGANTPGGPSSFGDPDGVTREFADAPGAPASLGAVFRSGDGEDGFDVYAIDPFTGVGQFAFRVTPEEVAAARAAADATRLPILVGDGMGITLYVLQFNSCYIQTTYPDGKVAAFSFPC